MRLKELSKTKKQALSLYFSTIFGTGLGVLVSIVNTRNLSPADYGDVRYVVNLISFFSGIFLIGYFVSGSRLLALAKTRQEAQELKGVLFTVLAITILFVMLSMILCGLYHQFVLHKDYYYLFYLAVPVCGNVQLLNYVNTTSQGDNQIYTIAQARLFPSLFYLVIAYLVYTYIACSSEIMLLLQNGIYIATLLVILYFEHPSFKNLKLRWHQLKEENKSYGLHVYYGSLSNVTVQYIAGITLGLFALDNKYVGFYSLALTISAPLAMLPNIIATTYFKRFATQEKIDAKILKMTFLMSIISFAGFCAIIFPLVGILYDDSYYVVGMYACFLALGSSFTGLGDVFNRFLGAHGHGKEIRNAAFVSGAFQIVGYTFGIYLFGITGAITTRIFAAVAAFSILVIYYLRFRKNITIIN